MMNSDDLYGMELDRRLAAEQALAAVAEVVEAYESCGPKQQSTRDVLAAVRAAFECSALHGLDYRAAFYRVWERCEELKTSVAEHQYNALEMARKAEQAERRAEEAEFHVEQLRDALDSTERQSERLEAVLAQVRRAFDLQCPPMSPENYVDRGAWMAHSWWNAVLGGILNRANENSDVVLCSCGEPIGHANHCDSCCGCGVADQHEHMAMVEHLRRCPICNMRFDNPCDHQWLDRPESDTRECLICGTEVAG